MFRLLYSPIFAHLRQIGVISLQFLCDWIDQIGLNCQIIVIDSLCIHSRHIALLLQLNLIFFELAEYIFIGGDLYIPTSTILRLDLTSLNASSKVRCLSFIIKARTMAADRVAPDTQCTKTYMP